MIKLIASDYDGTLNRTDNTVSDFSRQTIAKFRQSGGIFTISTGRNQPSLKIALEKAGIFDDIAGISCQGAFVSLVQSGKLLRESYISNSIVQVAIEMFSDYAIQLYEGEKVYRNRQNSVFAQMYRQVTGVEPIFVDSFTSHITKVPKLIIAEFSSCPKFKQLLHEFKQQFDDSLSMDFTGEEMLEIYSSEAGKGNATKFLAEQYYGFSASEVAAFGDSRNDMSMLQYAGLGVAMQNSTESVKQVANYVCESNDNDGVAHTINRILEKKL